MFSVQYKCSVNKAITNSSKYKRKKSATTSVYLKIYMFYLFLYIIFLYQTSHSIINFKKVAKSGFQIEKIIKKFKHWKIKIDDEKIYYIHFAKLRRI